MCRRRERKKSGNQGDVHNEDVQQLETSCTGQEVDNDKDQRQQSEIPLVSTEVREEQESTGITHTYKHAHACHVTSRHVCMCR